MQEVDDNSLNVAYERSSAEERRDRDALVANWQRQSAHARDHIHDYLNQVGFGDPKELHKAVEVLEREIDSMETFLNHAGGRRK
jgi:hypothetical protein